MFSNLAAKMNLSKKTSLLIPYFLVALLLIVLPMILILSKAFTSNGEGFDNWELVKSTHTWNIILRSLIVGILASIICLIIALPYSYFVATSNSTIFRIYALSLVVSPLAIFTIARIYALRSLFQLIFASDINSLNSIWFIVTGLVYLNLPLMIMPLYTVFKDMPRNIIEASSDLGNNAFRTFFRVIIPYGTKAILSGFALIFLASATTFVVSQKLLPNSSQLQLIGNQINEKINPGNAFNLSSGSALVIVVSGIFISIYAFVLIIPRIIFFIKKGATYE
ncbi:ABC transporter permease [Mycoplasmopsis citelli]|uniref:Polyamine (Spermidine/putrescine) ABC transporter permease n=1 Tax=Mycoplasmopsis citelli TaxID=171281 RepID=A0A449B1G5_9BACT|nr:ABC transporter permease [Mycoplasmopsis citelli]UUD35879.1 ABC transporter permease [Mycoplasmopsis citelli]VEU74411.1 polyamine (spermidine/putrescine) ABC transporter permease [Mycoplasmopsis citelli]